MDADTKPKDGLLSLSAEYLVAADLAKLGYAVSTASAGLPYDLIVDTGTQLFKVQVKSTVAPRKPIGSQPTQRYLFGVNRSHQQYTRDSFDIIAFVASDAGLIGYMSSGEVLNKSRVMLRGPDHKITGKIKKAFGIHELPFSEALDKAIQAKSFSLDEEITKAFGAKK